MAITDAEKQEIIDELLAEIRANGLDYAGQTITFPDAFNITQTERQNVKIPAIDERSATPVHGNVDLESLLQAYGLTEVQQIASEVSTNYMPRTEVQTALNGKAPAGYGLGAYTKGISDYEEAWLGGFYHSHSQSANRPPLLGSSCLAVCYYASNGMAIQVVTDYNGNSATRLRGGEWEYINPRMAVGVEYRTTERWNGKPVYTKRISLGALGGAESVVSATFSTTATTEVAVDHGWCGSMSLPSHNVAVYANLTTVYAYNISNAGLAGAEVIVTLKYTKD